MGSSDIDSLPRVAACEKRSLKEWIDEVLEPHDTFFIKRARFLTDVGGTLMLQRKAKFPTRSEMARVSGLSRVTVTDLESVKNGMSAKGKEGNRLNVIQNFLKPLDGAITFKFSPTRGDKRLFWTEVLDHKENVTAFTAHLVKHLRSTAGLSQAELGRRIHLPKSALQSRKTMCPDALPQARSSPMISRIEAGEGPAGIRTGTLFNIASACGYDLSVVMPAPSKGCV